MWNVIFTMMRTQELRSDGAAVTSHRAAKEQKINIYIGNNSSNVEPSSNKILKKISKKLVETHLNESVYRLWKIIFMVIIDLCLFLDAMVVMESGLNMQKRKIGGVRYLDMTVR